MEKRSSEKIPAESPLPESPLPESPLPGSPKRLPHCAGHKKNDPGERSSKGANYSLLFKRKSKPVFLITRERLVQENYPDLFCITAYRLIRGGSKPPAVSG